MYFFFFNVMGIFSLKSSAFYIHISLLCCFQNINSERANVIRQHMWCPFRGSVLYFLLPESMDQRIFHDLYLKNFSLPQYLPDINSLKISVFVFSGCLSTDMEQSYVHLVPLPDVSVILTLWSLAKRMLYTFCQKMY